MHSSRSTQVTGRRLLGIALAFICVALAMPASAQDFPARRVRFLIGQPPGGGSDVLARLLGDKLGHIWRQPFVVESLPG